MDDAIVGREGISPIERAIRITLMVYLSPLIALVMAIGFVGMMASKLTKRVTRPAVEGVHSDHKLTGPFGFMRRYRSSKRTPSTRSTTRDRSNLVR